jgi:hypothetical protein
MERCQEASASPKNTHGHYVDPTQMQRLRIQTIQTEVIDMCWVTAKELGTYFKNVPLQEHYPT